MEKLDGRLVVVDASLLAQLIDLSRLAADTPTLPDELADALRGTSAQLSTSALLEP